MLNSWIYEYENMISKCSICDNHKFPATGLLKLGLDKESISDVNIMVVGLAPRTGRDGKFIMGPGIRGFFNNLTFTKNFCFDNMIKCSLNLNEIKSCNLKCVKYLLMEIDVIRPNWLLLIGCYNILLKARSKYINIEDSTIMGIKFFKFKHFSYYLYNNNKAEEEQYYFNLRYLITDLEGSHAF